MNNNEWQTYAVSYAVQIAKVFKGSIAVMCEVPIYPYSDPLDCQILAQTICNKLNEYDKLKAINESLLSALKEWVNLVSWTTSNGITTYDARNKKEKAIIIKAEEAIKLAEQ